MPALRFAFPSPVLRLEDGFRYYYLPLPADIADAFDGAGVRRVEGLLNGHPTRRAIQRRLNGERFLIVGKDLLRTVGASEGDTVMVEVWPDPEPDRVEMPEEFEAALSDDTEAAARFWGFTPGRQRSLAHYVTSAKRPETRWKRAEELTYKLRTHTLYDDLRSQGE